MPNRSGSFFKARVAVIVKAYPRRHPEYGESICVAGLLLSDGKPQWIRIYPVPFRDLPKAQQFAKWDIVDIDIAKSGDDPRPESYIYKEESIRRVEHLSTEQRWSSRRSLLDSLTVVPMCEIIQNQSANGTSISITRPVGEVTVATEHRAGPDGASDPAHDDTIVPLALFGPARRVDIAEVIPVKFRYTFRCSQTCKGHAQQILDWELGALFRNERSRLATEQAAIDSVIAKYTAMANSPNESLFAEGSLQKHPASFCVIGVLPLPAGPTQDALFLPT